MPGPRLLTPEVQDIIVNALAAGNYIETAASLAGINRDTLRVWLKRGATSRRGVLRQFHKRVTEAIAKAEVRDVTAVARAAADGDWKAAAWRLERKYPKRWGRREEHTLKGDAKAPLATGLAIKVLPSNVVDAEGRVLKDNAVPAQLTAGEQTGDVTAASGLMGAMAGADPGSQPGRPDQEQVAPSTNQEEDR